MFLFPLSCRTLSYHVHLSQQILLPVHGYTVTPLYYTLSLLHGYSTLLFYMLVSSLHSSLLDTCYTDYYYFMYLYHWLHGYDTLVFHVLVSSFHGYSTHCMYLSYGFICILTLIVHVFLLHGLLLHGYSCNPVTWPFPVTDIDIYILTRHVSYWYPMCGGGYLLHPTSLIFHFLLSCLVMST